MLHSRFLSLGNAAGKLEAMDTRDADIEVLTEGVGPHPLFNGVTGVIIAGLAEPEARIEDGQLSIRVSGLVASLQRARLHRGSNELVVELEPSE